MRFGSDARLDEQKRPDSSRAGSPCRRFSLVDIYCARVASAPGPVRGFQASLKVFDLSVSTVVMRSQRGMREIPVFRRARREAVCIPSQPETRSFALRLKDSMRWVQVRPWDDLRPAARRCGQAGSSARPSDLSGTAASGDRHPCSPEDNARDHRTSCAPSLQR